LIFHLIIWIAAGAIAGALVGALRSPEKSEAGSDSNSAVQLMAFAGTGALIGSAIYATLVFTLYDGLSFSF
jgi:hydroxyethylthiazole kinase-like sugar kinase family protein